MKIRKILWTKNITCNQNYITYYLGFFVCGYEKIFQWKEIGEKRFI